MPFNVCIYSTHSLEVNVLTLVEIESNILTVVRLDAEL